MNENLKTNFNDLELKEFFQVKNGEVHRWGFFAQPTDGMYVIYKPQVTDFKIGTYDCSDEFDQEPGSIQENVDAAEIKAWISSLGTIRALSLREVTLKTPDGWYCDI